jgi:hypothetical protein
MKRMGLLLLLAGRFWVERLCAWFLSSRRTGGRGIDIAAKNFSDSFERVKSPYFTAKKALDAAAIP